MYFNHTLTTNNPHREPLCCSPSAANAWLQCLTELALVYGDDDAGRAVSGAASHFLRSLRPWATIFTVYPSPHELGVLSGVVARWSPYTNGEANGYTKWAS